MEDADAAVANRLKRPIVRSLQTAIEACLDIDRRLIAWKDFAFLMTNGILLCVLSLIGNTDKRVIKICAGDGVECNAANLIINHGWTGLLFDGNVGKIGFGRRLYARHLNTLPAPPMLVHAWVDTENVDGYLRAADIHAVSLSSGQV